MTRFDIVWRNIDVVAATPCLLEAPAWRSPRQTLKRSRPLGYSHDSAPGGPTESRGLLRYAFKRRFVQMMHTDIAEMFPDQLRPHSVRSCLLLKPAQKLSHSLLLFTSSETTIREQRNHFIIITQYTYQRFIFESSDQRQYVTMSDHCFKTAHGFESYVLIVYFILFVCHADSLTQ